MFSSCKESEYEICRREISETRECFYFVRNSDFVASFTSGQREGDYQLDGVHTEMVDYGVLVVDFVDKTLTKLPQFLLEIDGEKYAGIMEFNPYNNTFCVDIEKRMSGGEKVVVSLPDFGFLDTLVYISDMWQVDHNLATEIAISAFGERIKTLIVDGKLEGEIFQKLITPNKRSVENVFWNICLFSKSGEILTCTIDVITGQIVAM